MFRTQTWDLEGKSGAGGGEFGITVMLEALMGVYMDMTQNDMSGLRRAEGQGRTKTLRCSWKGLGRQPLQVTGQL